MNTTPAHRREHWPLWRDFIRAEQAVGGPDCQFTLMLEHARIHNGLDYADRHGHDAIPTVWLLGCYGAHHVAPSAHAVWSAFSARAMINKTRTVSLWLREHWDALPVRREMRSHRMLSKRHECLVDFARYALSERWRKGDFDTLWDDSQKQVKFYGRYMAIKFLELLRRTVRPDVHSYDTRARHAWSPRACMALLYPEHVEWLADRDRNDAKTVARVERLATRIKERLAERDVQVTYFQLQGLLCNYKEMLYGRFYPGAGHDEELHYLNLFRRDFDRAPWLETRASTFPHKYLGERHRPGWKGIRPSIGERWMHRGAHLHKPKGHTGGYGI